MTSEERLLILKMLQDGTLSAEQALRLLETSAPPPADPASLPDGQATQLDGDSVLHGVSLVADAEGDTVETAIPPPISAGKQDQFDAMNTFEADVIGRAKAKIAAARERVAVVAEQLAATDEKITEAEMASSPLDELADAFRSLPGMRSVFEALSGLDPTRMTSEAKKHSHEARRQVRKVGRRVTNGFDEMVRSDINRMLLAPDPTLTDHREGTLDVKDGSLIRIRNPFGNITLQPADVDRIRVAATICIWEPDILRANELRDSVHLQVEANETAGTISCTGPEKSRKVSINLVVLVPLVKVRITAMTPSGDIAIEGLRLSSLVAATASGDIRLTSLIADTITTESISGEITLQSIISNVSARSTSGNVNLKKVNATSVNISVRSGDISIDTLDTTVVVCETASGDIELHSVQTDDLTIKSISGDLICDCARLSGAIRMDTSSGWSKVILPGPQSPLSLSITAVSGDISLTYSPEIACNVKITGRTGTVVTPDYIVQRAVGVYEGTNGSSPALAVELSTVSGDVTVSELSV